MENQLVGELIGVMKEIFCHILLEDKESHGNSIGGGVNWGEIGKRWGQLRMGLVEHGVISV